MGYTYAYIFSCIAIVGIGVFLMYYFWFTQTYSPINPQYDQSATRKLVDEQKARELAENSVGDLKMFFYGYHFTGIIYDWGYDHNGTKKLNDVRLSYQSVNPSVGEIIVTEDPMLTKVINATVIPRVRLGSTG